MSEQLTAVKALRDLASELNAMMDSLEDDTPHDAIYQQLRQRWQETQAILDGEPAVDTTTRSAPRLDRTRTRAWLAAQFGFESDELGDDDLAALDACIITGEEAQP